MSFNVRVDETRRFTITGERQVLDHLTLPESMKRRHGEYESQNMVYYEIKIECKILCPEIDFTRWDPSIMRETSLAYHQNKLVPSPSTTTTTTTSPENKKTSEKRRALTRKQKTNIRKKSKKNILSDTSHTMRSKLSFSLESGIAVIDKKFYCLLSGQIYTGNYWVLLMTHPLDGKKTDTNISYGTDPIHEIFLHNNLLTNERSTSAAAPFWGADAILGPFGSLGEAVECSEELVDGTRGETSKRNKTIDLHREHSVNLYLSHIVEKNLSYPEYVHTLTPPSYIKAYRDLFHPMNK